MISSKDNKKTLFRHINEKREQSLSPYILLLGAGASLSSGCPSMRRIVTNTIDNYGIRDSQSIDEAGLFDEFFNIIKDFTENERRLVAGWLFKDIKPSLGYQHLAQLIKTGYFDIILTTNYDNLLEDALNQIGLTQSQNYIVLIVGKDKEEFIRKQIEYANPRIKILKLHGDLIAGEFKFTPEESYTFPPIIRDCIQKYLQQELIIIGYRVQDADVIECLLGSEQRIWYVNPYPPENWVKNMFRGRHLSIISGEDGEFDHFFQELFTFLYPLNQLKMERIFGPTIDSFPLISAQLQTIINKLKLLDKLEKLDHVYEILCGKEASLRPPAQKGVPTKIPMSKTSEESRLQVELQQKQSQLRQLEREKKLYKNPRILDKLSIEINNLMRDIHNIDRKLNKKKNGGYNGKQSDRT